MAAALQQQDRLETPSLDGEYTKQLLFSFVRDWIKYRRNMGQKPLLVQAISSTILDTTETQFQFGPGFFIGC